MSKVIHSNPYDVYQLHNSEDRAPQFKIKATPGRLWHLEQDRSQTSDEAMTEHIIELRFGGFFDAELRAFGRMSITSEAFKKTYLPLHTFAFGKHEGFRGHDDGLRRRPPTIEPKTIDSSLTTAAEAKRLVGEFFDTLPNNHSITPFQLVVDYHEWLKIRTRARQLNHYIDASRSQANHPAGKGRPDHSSHMERGTYSFDTETHHYELRQDPITGEPLEAKAYNRVGVYGVDEIESRRAFQRAMKSWETLGKQP
jgi:hypothetical protein